MFWNTSLLNKNKITARFIYVIKIFFKKGNSLFFLQYYLNQKTIFCHKVALHINRIVLFEEELMFPSRDI